MRVGWALLALVLVLAIPMPAQAAPATITLRAELPLEVTGTHEARGTDARFLLEGPAGTAAFLLQADAGQATRVIHRMWGYVNMAQPQAGLVWDDKVEHLPLSLDGALLALDERRDGFSLLAYGGDVVLGSGPERAALLVGALDAPKTVHHVLDRTLLVRLNPPSDEDNFQHVLPAGTLQARATDGRVVADGPLRLFVTDAVLTYRGPSGVASIPAHFREESRPGTLYNPVTGAWSGPGSHPEYVQEYLLVEATAGHFDLQYAGLPASLYSDQSLLSIDGRATLPQATGTVAVTQDGRTTRHLVRGDDLELSGRFTLRAHDVLSSPARTQIDGDGDLTAVTYAGVDAQYDWTKAAAAGLGALLLAAAGWVLFHAKTLGPAVASAVAGYARVSGQEILEHPGRQEVYERVKAYPGISFVQLADQVGFGQSTLNYHLRVLEKNGYITSVKDGRYLRFFDRTAGTYAGPRKLAVSALRNATTAAIARHIRANPGVVQRDLAAAFGVTASTVNWHINRLTGAGLVSRSRDAHFTRHYLSEGWSQLPADEAERQATAPTVPGRPIVVAHG